MKLAAESHQHIETFLRAHLGAPSLQLPHIIIHIGVFAGFITTALKVGAMTVGRHVLLAPRLVRRDAAGRPTVPGWLIVHESVHLVQYQQQGMTRFLFSYFGGYWRGLRRCGRMDAAARLAAYLAIDEESAAREAEVAYQLWRANIRESDEGHERRAATEEQM